MLALAGGSIVFLVFIIVLFAAVVFGYYTRSGSGINQRPSDGRGQAPDAEGASHIGTEDADRRSLNTHGTQ